MIQLSEKLKGNYCTFLDNFFNSPALVDKLFEMEFILTRLFPTSRPSKQKSHKSFMPREVSTMWIPSPRRTEEDVIIARMKA